VEYEYAWGRPLSYPFTPHWSLRAARLPLGAALTKGMAMARRAAVEGLIVGQKGLPD
jgi:hypothetical protein